MEEPDKKDRVESAKYDENIFLLLVPYFRVFGRFFHGSRSGFSGSDPDFLADPDPDTGK